MQGINYLIPLKAELEDELDAEYNCLNVEHLMDSMKGDSNIVVLDSCRNDPFPASSHRGANTRGLAAVKRRPANSIIVYAAAAGSTAQDGVFTPILTKHITEKNKSFSDLLIQVRKEVHIKTDGVQEPGEYRQVTDPIYVAGIDKTAPVAAPAPTVALAHPPAAAPAVTKPEVKTGGDLTYSINGVSFTMKPVAAVTDAVLGDNNWKDWNDRYTNKEHKVSLSAYYIGETEVTQELWQAVMDVNPSYFKDSSKNPVEQVTWYDCVTFCNELTDAVMGPEQRVYKINGEDVTADFRKKGFRLPIEAEWEYAAMGGKWQHKYAGCNLENKLEAYAWYYKNSGSKTHEVGKKKANKLGLYDMSGNVWEWCWDWYSSTPPAGGQDPVGAASGSYRVERGGGWDYNAERAERAYRYGSSPGYSSYNLGLRLGCRP